MWNVLLSFSGLVALIQLLFLPFFPESPAYLLLQKGDKAGCLKAMKQLWGEGNYHTEFDDMMKEKAVTKGTKIMNVLELLKERSVFPQLSIMLLILLSLQLCGLKIFRTASVQESIIPYVSLGVSISEIISIIFCSTLIDRFGRKVLLWGGYTLMCSVLGLLTMTLSLQHRFFWMHYFSVILIFLFVIFYGIGP
ncbi:Solute carrier family 2, facilitated glucose transporter member 11, partial [Calypte anna]